LINTPVYTKDFGIIGQVYQIKEMDFLEHIQVRLQQMQKSGELEKINKEATERIKAHLDRPMPVSNISATTKYRKWFINPSTVIANDIKDSQGKIIVKVGTVVNPFNYISLRSTFIFYDGDNKSQITWAMSKVASLKNKAKLILVKGSIIEQHKLFRKKILFDQNGRLVDKFKIKHTPATAMQHGMQIIIEEQVP
jgi:conjugal transfer pilus assembly protein TraW